MHEIVAVIACRKRKHASGIHWGRVSALIAPHKSIFRAIIALP
jgi:hypothetical protein